MAVKVTQISLPSISFARADSLPKLSQPSQSQGSQQELSQNSVLRSTDKEIEFQKTFSNLSGLTKIPSEALLRTFLFVPAMECLVYSRVSKTWNKLFNTELFWQQRFSSPEFCSALFVRTPTETYRAIVIKIEQIRLKDKAIVQFHKGCFPSEDQYEGLGKQHLVEILQFQMQIERLIRKDSLYRDLMMFECSPTTKSITVRTVTQVVRRIILALQDTETPLATKQSILVSLRNAGKEPSLKDLFNETVKQVQLLLPPGTDATGFLLR